MDRYHLLLAIATFISLVFVIRYQGLINKLRQDLHEVSRERRRLWATNTMNEQAWRIENFRVNNKGYLPCSLAEVTSMFDENYLGFYDRALLSPDYPGPLRIRCHESLDGSHPQDTMNFSYFPPGRSNTERVELAYHDPFQNCWYVRAIFASGPKYQF